MEMFQLKCPHCGAELEAEDGLETFYCKYCGGKIILEGQSGNVIDAKVRIKELEHEKRLREMEIREREQIRKETYEDDWKQRKMVIGILLFCFLGGPLLLLLLFLFI